MARMGDNEMCSTHATINKIGSKFNTVTLDRSDSVTESLLSKVAEIIQFQ